MEKITGIIILSLISLTCYSQVVPKTIISAPAGDEYVIIRKNGQTILPNGRIISPSGKTHQVAPHPYGLAISNDGNIAITANSGTSPLSISILKNIQSANPKIMQIPEKCPAGTHCRENIVSSFRVNFRENQCVFYMFFCTSSCNAEHNKSNDFTGVSRMV